MTAQPLCSPAVRLAPPGGAEVRSAVPVRHMLPGLMSWAQLQPSGGRHRCTACELTSKKRQKMKRSDMMAGTSHSPISVTCRHM